MVINQSTLSAIFKNFNTLFQNGLKSATPMWEKVATRIPSSAKSENYSWLGNLVALREWIGERVVQNLKAYSWEIANKHYEGTVAVNRDDIEDDQIGVFAPLVSMLGNGAAMHPDNLVFGLLNDAFDHVCYDGQYFLDSDHPYPGGTQNNVGSAALDIDSYAAARTAMSTLVDDKGDPLGIVPDTLVVPPALEMTARQILNAEMIEINSLAQTNVYRNSAQLVISPRISTATYWFLMQANGPLKPLLFQDRKRPEFVALNRSDDPNVFENNEFKYGVDYRGNAGYGLWQLIYGSTGTT
jgi:phage major head subunit gpT-like protein